MAVAAIVCARVRLQKGDKTLDSHSAHRCNALIHSEKENELYRSLFFLFASLSVWRIIIIDVRLVLLLIIAWQEHVSVYSQYSLNIHAHIHTPRKRFP